eukprot:10426942-Karenia_brevis.AAC.1
MGDPYHDRDLRTHKGAHPLTMQGVARNIDMIELKRFAATFRTWLRRDDGSDTLVVPVCRRERHL